MSYASDGIGAGLMQLSNIFGTMLMKRMDAKWEDENYQKRLEASNRAEVEKYKLLEEWKSKQLAGSRTFVGEDNQVMVQDVNAMGGAIGAPRAARPDESFGFNQAQSKSLLDMQKLDTEIKAKESTIQKNEETTKTEASRRNYYDARAKKALAEPTSGDKPVSLDKAKVSTAKQVQSMIQRLGPEDAQELLKAYNRELGAAMDGQDLLVGVSQMLADFSLKVPKRQQGGYGSMGQ